MNQLREYQNLCKSEIIYYFGLLNFGNLIHFQSKYGFVFVPRWAIDKYVLYRKVRTFDSYIIYFYGIIACC